MQVHLADLTQMLKLLFHCTWRKPGASAQDLAFQWRTLDSYSGIIYGTKMAQKVPDLGQVVSGRSGCALVWRPTALTLYPGLDHRAWVSCYKVAGLLRRPERPQTGWGTRSLYSWPGPGRKRRMMFRGLGKWSR